jgi:hypothetical protein
LRDLAGIGVLRPRIVRPRVRLRTEHMGRRAGDTTDEERGEPHTPYKPHNADISWVGRTDSEVSMGHIPQTLTLLYLGLRPTTFCLKRIYGLIQGAPNPLTHRLSISKHSPTLPLFVINTDIANLGGTSCRNHHTIEGIVTRLNPGDEIHELRRRGKPLPKFSIAPKFLMEEGFYVPAPRNSNKQVTLQILHALLGVGRVADLD